MPRQLMRLHTLWQLHRGMLLLQSSQRLLLNWQWLLL
jgi:hypothetical protein